MQRELGEEAGYSAAPQDALGPMLPCPGYSDEVIHCFLARELTLGEPPAGDDDEDLEVVLMSPAALDAALASGDEWLDGKSVTAGSAPSSSSASDDNLSRSVLAPPRSAPGGQQGLAAAVKSSPAVTRSACSTPG